jgi:hypothetical protein
MTVQSEIDPPRRFRWPADYYSGPSPKAVLPAGVTYGCGAAGAVALVVIFLGGVFLSGGGFTKFMDFAITMSVGEMRGMYGPDVSAARKKSLDAEIGRLREHYREGRVATAAMQPFLQELRNVVADGKVTGPEAGNLEAVTARINARAKKR